MVSSVPSKVKEEKDMNVKGRVYHFLDRRLLEFI